MCFQKAGQEIGGMFLYFVAGVIDDDSVVVGNERKAFRQHDFLWQRDNCIVSFCYVLVIASRKKWQKVQNDIHCHTVKNGGIEKTFLCSFKFHLFNLIISHSNNCLLITVVRVE